MHKFWIIGCLMLSGCSIDHDASRSQRGGVGVFPERSALPGSQAERTKPLRRAIMSGESPHW